MASIKDKIKAAQSLKKEDGSRLYSDDEIYAKLVGSSQGQEALKQFGEKDLRDQLGLTAPVSQDNGPLRIPKMIGEGLVAGAGQTLGLPGSAIHLLNNLLPEEMKTTSPLLLGIPTGEQVNDFTAGLGLNNRPELEPQNVPEKFLNAGSTGAGAALPFSLMAGPEAIPQLVTSGVTAGLAGEAANELLPGNPWAQILASVAGGMVGQSGARSVEEALARGGSATKLAQLEEEFKNFDAISLGLRQDKAAIKDNIVNSADTSFASAKASAEAAHGLIQGAHAGVVDSVASGLHPTVAGWQDAGDILRAKANDWFKTGLPKGLESAWKPVDDAIAGDTPAELRSFDSALTSVNRRAGSAQALVDQLTPSLPKALRGTLDDILKAQGTGDAAHFTWDDARALRSALGEAMHDPRIMPTIGDTNLKTLYAALTDDLKGVAKAQGVAPEFDAANEASKKLFSIAEGPIAKVLDANKSSGAVAKDLATKGKVDAEDLTTLRSVIPEGMDALGASALRLNKDLPWDKLTPSAQAALVPVVTARQALDSATADLANSATARSSSISSAKAIAESVKDATRVEHKTWSNAHAMEKDSLRRALQAARDSAKTGDSNSKLASGIDNLSRGIAGGTFGGLLLDSAGLNADALLNSKIGAAAAIGLPVLAHGVNQLTRDPVLAAGPFVGLSTGNALNQGR